jgi:hypothetical protein
MEGSSMTKWIFFLGSTLKIRWQFAYIFLMLASGCTNAQTEDRLVGEHTINYYRNSPEDIITLKIPKGYIDYQIVGGLPRKPIESDLYFTADAISLQPRSKENNESFVYPSALLKQISFSIKSNYAIVLEERHERLQRILGGRFDTLSRPCVRTKVLTLRFDLERHIIDATTCPEVGAGLRDDILVERNADASIKTIMNCMTDDIPDRTEQIHTGKHLSYRPDCSQTYLLPELNARVTIRYAREYNKDWRDLQQRINALLISFIQNKP